MVTEQKLTTAERQFYDRQLRLPELGQAGQLKLKANRVLVVGAGGLGCPVLEYLATAGVGTLGICDGDIVDISNLHRQPLYTVAQTGQPKAQEAATRISALNPFIQVVVYPHALSVDNAIELFSHYDLVLDCTDNYATKYLLNDAAVLTKTPLLQASIYQMQGQIWLYTATENAPCMRCTWPEQPEPECMGTCGEVGVLGAVPGVFGTLQATEALKWLLGIDSPLQQGDFIQWDLTTFSPLQLQREAEPTCPACSKDASLVSLTPDTYNTRFEWEVSLKDIERWPSVATYIDIRDASEIDSEPIECFATSAIPMDLLKAHPEWLAKNESGPVVLVCQSGKRSQTLVKSLRSLQEATNYQHLFSLLGGVTELKRQLSLI